MEIEDLLGDKLREELHETATGEVNALSTLPEPMQQLYIELIRVAALCVPLNLSQDIDPSLWGFPASYCKVPLLELVQILNLYVARGPHCYTRELLAALVGSSQGFSEDGDSDVTDMDVSNSESGSINESAKLCYILFPEIVLDEIAANIQHPRLPFWSSYYKVLPTIPFPSFPFISLSIFMSLISFLSFFSSSFVSLIPEYLCHRQSQLMHGGLVTHLKLCCGIVFIYVALKS